MNRMFLWDLILDFLRLRFVVDGLVDVLLACTLMRLRR